MLNDTTHARRVARLAFYGGLSGILGIILIGWFFGSKGGFSTHDGQLIALGRLFGLIATVAVLLEVFLMSRIPFIEEGFDLHENIDLHRLTGYAILAAISAHVMFLIIGYAAGHAGWWHQFILLNTSYEDVFKATLGTIVFFGATTVSVKIARDKLPYEIWFLSHLAIYGAILLTFMHQINTGTDFLNQKWFLAFWYALYFLVFGLLVYYRGLRQLISYKKHHFIIQKVVMEATDTYSVYITGKDIANYQYKAGQYATWRFFTKATWWESHPYSFSSVPGLNYLRFTFKSTGDFGHKLISMPVGTQVFIDGPRGAFTNNRNMKRRVVLIAGGIGVAAFMGTIDALLKDVEHVMLLYASRNPSSAAFSEELANYKQQGLLIRNYYSAANQRIDESILSQIVNKDVAVFICGPDKMSKAIEQSLVKLGQPKKQIITERFAY